MHVYKLSFANSTMIAAHEVSAAREPIGNAEKRLQLTSRFSRNASIDLTSLFLERIVSCFSEISNSINDYISFLNLCVKISTWSENISFTRLMQASDEFDMCIKPHKRW